jgi:PTS system fructose-specific IIC component
MVGSAAAGGVSMAVDAELRAPHGGVFVLGLIDGKVGYLVAGVVGTLVTAGAVAVLKAFHREPLAGADAAPERVLAGV